jgi:hypothetical protein
MEAPKSPGVIVVMKRKTRRPKKDKIVPIFKIVQGPVFVSFK